MTNLIQEINEFEKRAKSIYETFLEGKEKLQRTLSVLRHKSKRDTTDQK